MPIQPTVFSQVTSILPHNSFRRCVARYDGERKVQSFTCMDQFLCMAFAQLTYRESLRDIETCLRVMRPKLYHMGLRGRVSRSTLAYANETRNWRIYADFAQTLIAQAHPLYRDEDFGVELDSAAYALDSTTVSLCLSLFPWARFQAAQGAVRLHTLLSLRGSIPGFIHISDGKMHDVKALDLLVPQPGAFYVMDRGYVELERLHALHQAQAFFVIRDKRGVSYRRRYSRPVEAGAGLRCDQTVVFCGAYSAKAYPSPLRRVRYDDPDSGERLAFLTNNFALPAMDVVRLYRARWQIELFFRWIKQHLRITAFYGTSENAVKTQIWIAVSVYVLVAILKKRLRLDHSLYTILQILGIAIFEKKPILQVFSELDYTPQEQAGHNQLMLFEL